MNYNYKILSSSYKTINYINKLLVNYPNKEVILKHNIEKNNYKIIELIFSYNINDTNRIKDKYLKALLVSLSMLDFYLRVSYDKKIISKHQFEVVVKFLMEIKRMVYGLKRGVGHEI